MRTLLPLVLIVVLVGCDSFNTTETSEARRWVHNVSGGGADFYPGETDDISFRITFHTRSDANGNVVGDVHWTFPDGRLASRGDVYCLDVRDNRAYMAYRVEAGEFGGYGVPGNTVALGFEDNGEGSGAPADRQSFIYFGPGFDIDCVGFGDFVESGSPGSGFPVEWVRGNVQVR